MSFVDSETADRGMYVIGRSGKRGKLGRHVLADVFAHAASG